jgi:hypothetical protein
MKKYFFFSKSNLKYIEIKHFKARLIISVAALALVIASIVVLAFFIVGSFSHTGVTKRNLRQENTELRKTY